MIDSQFEKDGFRSLDDVVPSELVNCLIAEVTPQRGTPNRRSLLRDSELVASFAVSPEVKSIAEAVLAGDAFPVRALLFDKVATANWGVPWHQDLVIAVAERVDTPGFSGWSVKDGIPHVLPPVHVLETMVTLRVHLDDCTEDNGPLRVLPGSHRHGVLDDRAINRLREIVTEKVCLAPRGSVLALRPLLLHASSAARTPAHRRILHIEFASQPLPGPLNWPTPCRRSVISASMS